MANKIDIQLHLDKKYGKLIPIRESGRNKFQSVLWECLCDCGHLGNHVAWQVVGGKAKSCGCSRLETCHKKGNRHPDNPYRNIYRDYQDRAHNANLTFEISFDEFKTISCGDCFYCGSPPKERNRKGSCVINGIDRIDSSVGYVLNNCRSACSICNMAKNDLSERDFLDWLDRLVKYRSLK